MAYQQKQINVIRGGKIDHAELYYKNMDNYQCILKIVFGGNVDGYEVSDTDFFNCFCQIRNYFANVTFLCKGAKVNVYPSPMARDMSKGLLAYQLQMGKHALMEDLVAIFDFADEDIVSTEEQQAFFNAWIKSLRS